MREEKDGEGFESEAKTASSPGASLGGDMEASGILTASPLIK